MRLPDLNKIEEYYQRVENILTNLCFLGASFILVPVLIDFLFISQEYELKFYRIKFALFSFGLGCFGLFLLIRTVFQIILNTVRENNFFYFSRFKGYPSDGRNYFIAQLSLLLIVFISVICIYFCFISISNIL
jgi:hypothetical protein